MIAGKGDPIESVKEDRRYLPARMLNEFAYCPRLFHIEHVEGLFADNRHTVEGRSVHRRVDRKADPLPESEGDAEPDVSRSVTLSSEQLGLIAKIDLIETTGDAAVPVETKKGKAPDIAEGAWEPERVQLCAQGLLLREHGFRCEFGYIYYAGSRHRVKIDFDDHLVARTTKLTAAAREMEQLETAPPPLVDSPKCPGCSLVGICLPDELNFLAQSDKEGPTAAPRRLVPARSERVPVYVQGYGGHVSKSGENVIVKSRTSAPEKIRIRDVAHLAIYGNSQITTQAIQALCRENVPISWLTKGGWFYGTLQTLGLPNVELRRAQFRAAFEEASSLRLAQSFIAGKISNCRTLLMRNHEEPPRSVLASLKRHVDLAHQAETLGTLLGIEGNAARLYFAEFDGMLKRKKGLSEAESFHFRSRNRRPPRDPVNAMLSFVYSLLAREFQATVAAVGLDPHVGFLHQPRPGRPALALDLMEEFRPIIADSVVITFVNNGEAGPRDFVQTQAGCAMADATRSRFIEAYERRMDTLVTHPVFDYRLSYRRVLEVQARLLGRVLLGEVAEYPPFKTR